MGINISKLLGSTSIAGSRSNGYIGRTVSNPVKNQVLYKSISNLDKTYGQSPVVDDFANTGKYFGDAVLKHIAYC